MHADLSKPETVEQAPEALLRLLDLELRQKRQLWQKAAARHRNSRMLGFLAIFVVISGAFFALFFLFTQAREEKSNSSSPSITNGSGH